MKRDEAIIKLRLARREFLETLVGVEDEDMLRPNVVEKWSLKDLLGHIAAWDEEMLRVIQAFTMQPEARYSYVISERDEFAVWNAEQIAARRDSTLEQIKSEFENARRDLIQVTEGMTDQVLARSKRTSWGTMQTGIELLNEIVAHDLTHAQDVRRWLKKRERWARSHQTYAAKRRESKRSKSEN